MCLALGRAYNGHAYIIPKKSFVLLHRTLENPNWTYMY